MRLEKLLGEDGELPARYTESQIRRETVWVAMRDGIRLATDLHLPPIARAPSIALRTPYGRANEKVALALMALARAGYAVISQDCRGTGDSEPESWDYYLFESEDGLDLAEWIAGQDWFDGFLAGCGGSYAGQTQWCMARHPRMSTIVPEVSGLGIAVNTAHLHMTVNAYSRSVGKGAGKVPISYTELKRQMLSETLEGGYFNAPLHEPFSEALLARYPELRSLAPSEARSWLWRRYCGMPPAERVVLVKEALGVDSVSIAEIEKLGLVFGHRISHDAHTVPALDPRQLCRDIHAPPLMITGWYDWGLNDALATWELLRREATEKVSRGSRLIITPAAHNAPGYHEGMADQPELRHNHRLGSHVGLLLAWYDTVRGDAIDEWPTVTYYVMGANEWRVAEAWPPPEARPSRLYLGSEGRLTEQAPQHESQPDRYIYDPGRPTPTLGGSILSSVYPPGSVDVSEMQSRDDILTYTTTVLEKDLDIAGPVRLVLYASSSAVDTDFSARLSDVFPDGCAIQLQSGILRARYRDPVGEPELLEPGRVYRLEIDMWATANRFKAGHRLRVDVSSADFPRFDRNTNRGGEPGAALKAEQAVYLDPQRPSHLILSVLTG
jgi:uncharacterized protein